MILDSRQRKRLSQEIINKDKWWEILSRFIDVLRINIFIVDHQGLVILPPDGRKYGGRLLLDRKLKFDLCLDRQDWLDKFAQAHELRSTEVNFGYGLKAYGIPIKITGSQVIGYMVIGPVILNKRLKPEDYLELAAAAGVDGEDLSDEIEHIRVVSNLMMNSIVDLLCEIVRDNVDLSIKEKELDQLKLDQNSLPNEIRQVAKEIYSSVRTDEILVTLLDLAMKMTNAECGSIMVVDEGQENLSMKISRGLNHDRYDNVKVKIGEQISGIAAKEKRLLVINGKEPDPRIKKYLKRPEIKQSLVMPLITRDHVYGILNLHTQRENVPIEHNIDNLQYLSKLVSCAF